MCVCNRLGEKGSNEPIGMKLTWHKHVPSNMLSHLITPASNLAMTLLRMCR